MITNTSKIAVLIDGDNAEAYLIDEILNEASKVGRVTVKRIYADWTKHEMNKWKEQLNKYAIRPVQKFSYTKGKNSTDSALIVDAMDIMHAKVVEGFCIVSSDSDYTGLAHRIREEGLFVMGIGRSQTPEAFVKACENFIYTEILIPQKETVVHKTHERHAPVKKEKKTVAADKVEKPEEPHKEIRKVNLSGGLRSRITNKPLDPELIDKAFDVAVNNLTGLALASLLGGALRKIDPTFDPRNYGHTSFRKFLEALKPRYELVVHDDNMTISLRRKEGETT